MDEKQIAADAAAGWRRIPWVAWQHPNGGHGLCSWVGATRDIIVTGVDEPHRGIPPWGTAYELGHTVSRAEAIAIARRLEGIVVTVFTNMPRLDVTIY